MQTQTSTRYAWKALHGLKSLRLTPTIAELPPAIRYTLNKDESLKPYFEHAIKLRLSNNGVSIQSKHTDNIQVNLLNNADSTSALAQHSKSESELFKALLESRETKSWDPDLKKLLVQIQASTNPLETFDQMSQRMDPYLKGLLSNLISNFKQLSQDNPEEKTDELVQQIMEAEKEQFMKLMSNTQRTTSVIDDLLVKRLDPAHIENEYIENHRAYLNKLETTDPFDRVDAEFNTINPLQAFLEASKLFDRLGEVNDDPNVVTDEAEAIRRITKIENDFSKNFEAFARDDSKPHNRKLNRIAARYKAITELLRDENRTKTLDPREEAHLRRYYSVDIKKLAPSAFLSFGEVLDMYKVQQKVNLYNRVANSLNNEELLNSLAKEYNNKDPKVILTHLKNAVRDELKSQWESYAAKVLPLEELNRRYVKEQEAYLSKEQFQLAQLELEKEELETKLLVADLYDHAIEPIVERLSQIDRDALHIQLKQAEQASDNEAIKTAASIVRRLVDFEYNQQQSALYKQMRRFAVTHPFTQFFHQDIDVQSFINHEREMINNLEKEIDAALSQEQLTKLTSSLKGIVASIDSSVGLSRDVLVSNGNKKRALVNLYNHLQRFGTKQAVVQFNHVQKLREKEAKQQQMSEEQTVFCTQMKELMESTRDEILSQKSIHKGLLSFKTMSKVMEVLESTPSMRQQVRQLIAPKKYYNREVQLEKTGRVLPKCKVVKKMTISAMPEGFRRKGDRKVVLTAKVKDLGLTDIEKQRLIAIAGPKYNKDSNSIRIVVRMFETPEQGEAYARSYLYELIETAKNEDLALETPIKAEKQSPDAVMRQIYVDFAAEDVQSADALDKWIMYKETGKKAVGADLTYGEGVREVVYGDKETRATKDEYGYNIQEEEEEDDDFFAGQDDE